jgi:hypothetical protein
MSALRQPQFSDYLSTGFKYEARTGSAGSMRPYTSGSFGSSASLMDDRTISTPAFSYDYTRNPTPSYSNSSLRRSQSQENTSHGLLQPEMRNSSNKKKKGNRRGRRRRRRRLKNKNNTSLLPIATDAASTAEAFRHKGNTPCLQWNDPNCPNKVVWGQRQQWLSASGESPGPRTAVNMMDRALNTNKTQPSVVIGGSKPKNDVDWAIYRASFIPSAQEYMLKDTWKNAEGGGRFSTATPKEELDWIAYYGSQIPARTFVTVTCISSLLSIQKSPLCMHLKC